MTTRSAACIFIASLVVAQAQEFQRQPIIATPVGYFTTIVPVNTAVPIASPLVCDAILEDQLQAGDLLRMWDATAQGYTIITRTASGWSEKVTLLPGQALWIENRHETAKAITITGYLPLRSTTFLDIQSGLNLFGLPYFNPLSLNDTPFAKDGAIAGDLQSADRITESESSRYWWLTAQGLWQGSELGADDKLQPFRAYWYNHRGLAGFSASFTRPYALPVALDEILPEPPILQCASQITLTLKVPANSTWDIYAMDLSATGTLDLVHGWRPVAESLPAKDGLIQWQDPAPVSGARLYLPARSDLDSDGDGSPDTHELFRYFTDPAIKDSDQDGSDNVPDHKRGTAPNESKKGGATYYVDSKIGNDNWRGIKAAANRDEGPLKNIRTGIAKAADGDTVIIAAGQYVEERQIWKTGGKHITLRPLGAVTIR